MWSRKIIQGSVCILVLFVSVCLYGCIQVYDVPYNTPEFSHKQTLDDLIGSRNKVVLEAFGSPEQVFSDEESIYYLYSGPAKTLGFVLIGIYPEDIRFCVLLEFNKEGIFKKYYIRRVERESLCDVITPLQGVGDASEEVLLAEAEIGNAAAQLELYKQSESLGAHDYKWLCKSAEAGNYRAQWELGYIYSNGLYGVRKDLVLSVMWYSLVEAGGHV